ncbi:hypothetical protein A5712_11100 [Mycobacterium sp. E2327]|nr:hypothetical protein A5712_11100 [Mycobacterium sp. E2327]
MSKAGDHSGASAMARIDRFHVHDAFLEQGTHLVLRASTRRCASGGIWAVFEVSSQGSFHGIQRSGSR